MVSAVVLVLTLLVSPSRALAQSGVPLEDIKPVTASGGWDRQTQKFSIANRIFERALGINRLSGEKEAFYVFDVSAFERFEAWFGVPDAYKRADADWKSNKKYRVLVDGAEVMAGTISEGEEPVRANIALDGARSIRIEVAGGVAVADPTLYRAAPDVQGVPVLVSPKADAAVTGKNATLEWNAVPGAESYGVEIVCTKIIRANPGSNRRIWTHQVDNGATRLVLDLGGLPTGTYRWRVIGFTRTGVTGKFSPDRVFTVSPP
jgi:hypothetical protein